jgi:diguanylate cyclase (GGDEF)-like protein
MTGGPAPVRPRRSPLLERLERLPPPATWTAALALVAAVGVFHAAVGPALSFQLFYLAPVSLAAWALGRRAGAVLAAAAAAVWLAVELGAPTRPPAMLAVWNTVMRLAALAVVGWMITALRRSLEQERTIARTDFLTGLSNWRAFTERAEAELNRARRYERPLSFAYIDLDDFKLVNDRYGHAAGDALLATVATTIGHILRRTDVVARLGGDEFAVLLPETPPEAAWIVLRKLHNALRIALEEGGWPVTASIGAVTCIIPPADVEELVRLADGLMYEAKRLGKNRVHHVVAGPSGTSTAD